MAVKNTTRTSPKNNRKNHPKNNLKNNRKNTQYAAPGAPDPLLDLTGATAEALRGVRDARRERAGRSGRPRFAGGWQLLLALTAFVLVAAGVLHTAPGAGRAVGAPASAATALALTTGTGALLTAAAMWLATWLGPVLLSSHEVTWLLPLPGDRGRMLRPRLLAGLGVAAATGAVGAVPLAAAAQAALGAAEPAAVLVDVPATVAGALLAAALGVLTQARPARCRTLRTAAALVAALGAVTAATSASFPLLGSVLAWSGPWGWTGRAVADAARGDLLPAALLTTAVVGSAAALLARAFRLLGELPAAELAARAQHGSRAGQGAVLLDVRGIALVAQSVARAGRGRARFRLPLPAGHPRLVLLWRDALALLRRPARIAAAVVCQAAGVLLLHLMQQWGQAPDHPSVSAPQAALFGWILVLPLYLAACALTEGARQDTDNLTRTRLLPFAPHTVALGHFVVPTAALCLLGPAVSWATCLLTGLPASAWHLWALVSAIGAPAAVGAALMTAYRGAMRYDLMFLSPDWYAVLPFLIWYAAPTLMCTAVAAPLLWQSVVSPHAALTGAVVQLAIASGLALALSAWRVRAQARAMSGTTPAG
ncbi:DUF6297 family protein [Streptomyces luteosporeus]|uniref:ABC transporter permease n=1 Tax=Streptomyces luteosporeus TaxID=173856 RepID=A0ABP6G3H2_9ACTN